MRPAPLIVGKLDEVREHLDQIDRMLSYAGVHHLDAEEMCKLRLPSKAKQVYGKRATHAIPPTDLWPNLVAFAQHVFTPLRIMLGKPIVLANGYRPPKYNDAVGGADRSRHIWAQAGDMVGGPQLRDAAIDLFLVRPEQPYGLGLYANRVHMDWGHKRRVWGSRMAELKAERQDRRNALMASPTEYTQGGV